MSGILWHLPDRGRVYALTLDDGPDPVSTAANLEVLAGNRVCATFFVLGERAARHPDLLARIVAEGHGLGNHLWQDHWSIRQPLTQFERDLLATDRLLRLQGMRPCWFRPAGGWYTPAMLRIAARHGYRCALGSLWPLDTLQRSVGFSAWLVERLMHPGAIVVLHEGGDRGRRTAEVLRRVLPRLAAGGWRSLPLPAAAG